VSHLGRWLSAQVDGELDGIERDRVLNHLAGCEACRQEANALRALKRRMIALGESVADSAIAGRVIERARSEPEPAGQVPGRAPWPSLAAPGGPWPRQPWTRQFRPGWRIATGSAGTALVAIGVLAFLLGGGQAHRPVPTVTPAVDAYWKKHISDTGQMPANGSMLTQTSPAIYAPSTIGSYPAKVLLRPSSP
jgi:anti-sigma factor RsiW